MMILPFLIEDKKVTREKVVWLRKKYIKGTRVECIWMDCVRKGTRETVVYVDDDGRIHVKWDDGKNYPIKYGEDKLEIIDQIRVIIYKPNNPGKEKYIDNTLEAMQEIVGGYIEIIPYTDDLVIVCNEEGKMKGLESNIIYYDDLIVGTIFLVGNGKDGDFRSLKDNEITKYITMERITNMMML